MTNPPRPTHTHRLGRSPLPAWLDGLHRRDAGELVVHTPDGDARPRPGWTVVAWSDGTVTVASPTTVARVYGPDGIAAHLDRAEAHTQRVTSLYEQWVKAGPPPLGTPIARWWDRRLVELHNAIHPPQQPCGCHNGDELCSGCRRCPDVCHGCDGPKYETREQ